MNKLTPDDKRLIVWLCLEERAEHPRSRGRPKCMGLHKIIAEEFGIDISYVSRLVKLAMKVEAPRRRKVMDMEFVKRETIRPPNTDECLSMKQECSWCGKPNDRLPQRYCRQCHNAHQRVWRPSHRFLSDEQRAKANARSMANVYQRRGLLKLKPCEECGATDGVQKHHDDYTKPLEVRFLCKSCHLKEHGVIHA